MVDMDQALVEGARLAAQPGPAPVFMTHGGQRNIHSLGWHLADLSDFEFRLVIRGRPFVLKNSKQAVVKAILPAKGRGRPCPNCRKPLSVLPSLVPSQKAQGYRTDAVAQIQAQWLPLFGSQRIPEPILVNAAIVTYRATLHRSDSSNLYQMPEDALQEAGVLEDDFQIAAHDGSRRRYDKHNPRVEITLTPFRED